LDPASAGRLPADWERLVAERKGPAAAEVRGLAVWGYYGFPREMLGVKRLSMFFYDDPTLLADMNEFWCEYTIQRLTRAVKEMEFDYALIWEGNCYNHGMLHSPKVFRELMAPHYRRLVEFFRTNHIDIVSVDSDGNVSELIPLLLDVGVTGLHPFEVASGMDVVDIGKKYPRLQIWGGLDKRAIARGRAAIDAELDRVLPTMKRRGGYAAGLDHNVPPDVSLADHRYYAETVRQKGRS
jgi:uroporphyrinogen decarboxylase